MKRIKKNLKIDMYLHILGFNFLIFMFLLIFFLEKYYEGVYDRAITILKYKNENLALEFNNYFSNIKKHLNILKNEKDIILSFYNNEHDNENLLKLKSIKNEDKTIKYIYIGYKNNKLLINDWEIPKNFDLTKRPWYINAKNKKENDFLIYEDIKTKEWLLSKSEAIYDNDEFIGAVVIDSNIDFLAEKLSKNNIYKTQRTYLIDINGKILIHPNSKYINKYFPYITEKIDKSKNDDILKYTLEGKKVIGYYNKLKNSNWYVVTAIDNNDFLYGIITTIFISFIIITIFLIILTFLFLIRFYKRFGEPVVILRERIKKVLRNEKIEKISLKNANKELKESINDIEELTKDSFQKKNSELISILEATNRGILVTNESEIIYFNSILASIFDIELKKYDKNQLYSIRMDILNKIKKTTFETEKEFILDKIFEIKKSYEYIEDTLELENGKIVKLESNPIIFENQLYARVWSFEDITEIESLEKEIYEKKLMLKEIEEEKYNTILEINCFFKNIINSFNGFVELLFLTPLNKIQNNYLKNIKNNIDYSNNYLNKLIKMSELEYDFKFKFEKINLLDIFDEIYSIFKINLFNENKNLLVLLNNIPKEINFDKNGLTLIFINLIEFLLKNTNSDFIKIYVEYVASKENSGVIKFNVVFNSEEIIQFDRFTNNSENIKENKINLLIVQKYLKKIGKYLSYQKQEKVSIFSFDIYVEHSSEFLSFRNNNIKIDIKDEKYNRYYSELFDNKENSEVLITDNKDEKTSHNLVIVLIDDLDESFEKGKYRYLSKYSSIKEIYNLLHTQKNQKKKVDEKIIKKVISEEEINISILDKDIINLELNEAILKLLYPNSNIIKINLNEHLKNDIEEFGDIIICDVSDIKLFQEIQTKLDKNKKIIIGISDRKFIKKELEIINQYVTEIVYKPISYEKLYEVLKKY
jgi:hypothetical protein